MTALSLSELPKEFHEELIAAMGEQKKMDRFVLRWDKYDEEPSYLFQMFVGDQMFQLKFRVFKTERGNRISTIKTMIEPEKYLVEEGGNRQIRTYTHLGTNYACQVAACTYLIHYAMYLDYRIGEVDLVMLPYNELIGTYESYNRFTTDKLILTVHDSITRPDFVEECVEHIPTVNVSNVTINMSRNFFNISGTTYVFEKLKLVKDLTINARAILRIDFLSKFEGSSLVYNCANYQSPIRLTEFVDYWLTHWNLKTLKRRILFNAKHSVWELADLKFKFKKTGRTFQNVNGTEKLLPPETEQENISTFEVSNNYLLIEFCPLNVEQ